MYFVSPDVVMVICIRLYYYIIILLYFLSWARHSPTTWKRRKLVDKSWYMKIFHIRFRFSGPTGPSLCYTTIYSTYSKCTVHACLASAPLPRSERTSRTHRSRMLQLRVRVKGMQLLFGEVSGFILYVQCVHLYLETIVICVFIV